MVGDAGQRAMQGNLVAGEVLLDAKAVAEGGDHPPVKAFAVHMVDKRAGSADGVLDLLHGLFPFL